MRLQGHLLREVNRPSLLTGGASRACCADDARPRTHTIATSAERAEKEQRSAGRPKGRATSPRVVSICTQSRALLSCCTGGQYRPGPQAQGGHLGRPGTLSARTCRSPVRFRPAAQGDKRAKWHQKAGWQPSSWGKRDWGNSKAWDHKGGLRAKQPCRLITPFPSCSRRWLPQAVAGQEGDRLGCSEDPAEEVRSGAGGGRPPFPPGRIGSTTGFLRTQAAADACDTNLLGGAILEARASWVQEYEAPAALARLTGPEAGPAGDGAPC